MKKQAKSKYNWNLEDIIKLKEFDLQIKSLKKEILEFTGFSRALFPQMKAKDFEKVVIKNESIQIKLTKLLAISILKEATNQEDLLAKKMKSQSLEIYLLSKKMSLPFYNWLAGKKIEGHKELDNKNAERLFNSVPKFKYELMRERKLAKHTLSIKEEELIAIKDVYGQETLQTLRSVIETKQSYVFKPLGAKKSKTIKTLSELNTYVTDPRAEYRQEAYKSGLSAYKNNLSQYFLIFQGIVKDWDAMSSLRGFDSPISARNIYNDLPDEVVSVLLKTVSKNIDVYQQYFKLKAKLLNQKKLSRFDLYAPLPLSSQKVIPYEKGLEIVLETFKGFSENFYNHAQSIVSKNHLDIYPSSVKQSGAFCMNIEPQTIPYVMLNYTNKLRDVSVLAHELGHGVHFLFAKNNSYATQSATLPLAETASTLAELMVFEKLVANSSKKDASVMAFNKLSDSYATILRQTYFAKFEIRAHELLKQGADQEDISKLHFETLKEHLNPAVEVDEIFKYEWAMIPHMVNSPFYVYAYAFGDLLSLSLFSMYKKHGKDFVKNIEEILATGGNEEPVEMLKKYGINILSEKFWQESFTVIRGWIDIVQKFFT